MTSNEFLSTFIGTSEMVKKAVRAIDCIYFYETRRHLRPVIGGACALVLQGIDLNRTPHDVDIILDNVDTILFLKKLCMESALITSLSPHSSPTSWGFSVKCGHITVDILYNGNVSNESTPLRDFKVCEWNLCTIQSIIAVKQQYHREKDLRDIEIINAATTKMADEISRSIDSIRYESNMEERCPLCSSKGSDFDIDHTEEDLPW